MQTLNENNQKISIKEFIEKSPAELPLEVLAGENSLAEHFITSPRTQKLGLALAGFSSYIHPGRIQILGQSEISYLEQLSGERLTETLDNLDYENICCILLTKNLRPPDEFVKSLEKNNLPVLKTSVSSTSAIGTISNFLSEELAPQTTIHGVLIEVFGLGILLLGDSGVGKSECALDLISRGHSLVSDDTVVLKKVGKKLEGRSPDFTAAHLEIRGLGIINIRDLFGVSSVKDKIWIDLCVELKRWDEVVNVERLGLDLEEQNIFEINVSKFVLPVSSGRNLAVLVETAVRVFLLRMSGINAAQDLIDRHTKLLTANE